MPGGGGAQRPGQLGCLAERVAVGVHRALEEPAGGGSIVAGSAKLHVSTDGGTSFSQYPMTPVTATRFTATFPPLTCGVPVRYYVTAALSNGGTNTDPTTAPTTPFIAPVQTGSSLVVAESFEGAATGWTWARP